VTHLALLSYRITIRKSLIVFPKAVDCKVTTEAEGPNRLIVRVSALGNGPHLFSIRTDNLEFAETDKRTVNLTQGKTDKLVWHAQIKSRDTPWVAVIIPDNEIDHGKEISGEISRQ
jgi:hypothetical protein